MLRITNSSTSDNMDPDEKFLSTLPYSLNVFSYAQLDKPYLNGKRFNYLGGGLNAGTLHRTCAILTS